MKNCGLTSWSRVKSNVHTTQSFSGSVHLNVHINTLAAERKNKLLLSVMPHAGRSTLNTCFTSSSRRSNARLLWVCVYCISGGKHALRNSWKDTARYTGAVWAGGNIQLLKNIVKYYNLMPYSNLVWQCIDRSDKMLSLWIMQWLLDTRLVYSWVIIVLRFSFS